MPKPFYFPKRYIVFMPMKFKPTDHSGRRNSSNRGGSSKKPGSGGWTERNIPEYAKEKPWQRNEPPKPKPGTLDRRADAAKWAAQRTADLELAGKLPFLFDSQSVERFKRRREFHRETVVNDGHSVEIDGRLVYKQRFNCPSDYAAAATKLALAEVFGAEIPGIEEAYDRFVQEKRTTSFEEFQKWAQGLIDLKKRVEGGR
jgi:hypothetical protein